ncbi:MAG: T9SS type A sorting domain-containing protein [Saprospiraceae bacterium]|nr:T9SS type A sorting domain-containing protein [Saprospiraceae bacterium]
MVASSSVKEVQAAEIGLKVFPNPVRDVIRLQTNADAEMETVYIYDLNGRLVKAHSNIHSSQVSLPKNNLTAGFYLMQVRTKDKLVQTQIIVQD